MPLKKYTDDDIARLARLMADEIREDFKLTAEAIDYIKIQVDKIPSMEATIEKILQDNATFRAAMRATNQDVQDHERRITHLERYFAA